MHKISKPKKLVGHEDGIVSIVITMVFMVVITLIVLGFAQLARREQRQALDRQLNTQAFYAAESGINDAQAVLATNSTPKQSCPTDSSSPAPYNNLNPVLDVNNGVAYTCLIVNPLAPDVTYSVVSTTIPSIANITAVDSAGNPQNVGQIKISWQDVDGGGNPNFSTPSPNFPFPPAGTWGAGNLTGVLRADIIPIIGSDYSRASLNRNNRTLFLYPQQDSDAIANNNPVLPTLTIPVAQIANGRIIGGECNSSATPNTPRFCYAIQPYTNAVAAQTSHFYIRLNAIYSPVQAVITVYDTAGNQLFIKGAQAVVDVTGKANDVLRRVQVRIPNDIRIQYPIAAVQSMLGICKDYLVTPTTSTASGTGVSLNGKC